MITDIGSHRVRCGNVMDSIDQLMNGEKADILYSDPPWGNGNIKYWATINKRHTGQQIIPTTYDKLMQRYKEIITKHVDGWVFLETGLQWEEETLQMLEGVLHNVVRVSLRYKSGSRLLPNVILIGNTNPTVPPYNNPRLIDLYGYRVLPEAVRPVVKPLLTILDPCCGMGYTAQVAKDNGMIFRGNELNAKRLAKTITRLKR